MSWLDACAYVRVGARERDPVPADDRGLAGRLAAIGTSGVGWIGRYSRVRGTVVSHESRGGETLVAGQSAHDPAQRRESKRRRPAIAATRDGTSTGAARREQLVEATLAAVGKHGAGVGMDEIAAEAGTSKTVVYRHFADRTELYVAVCTRVAVAAAAEAARRDREQRPARARWSPRPSRPTWRSSRPTRSCTGSSSTSRPLDRPADRRPDQQPVRPRRRPGGGLIAAGARAGRPRSGGRRRPGATASSGWSVRPPTGGCAPIAPCSAPNSPHT